MAILLPLKWPSITIMSAVENKPFIITRHFAAPRALVWDCYTQEKHLKKWWGPKGFKMLSCTLDLRVGGMTMTKKMGTFGSFIAGMETIRRIKCNSSNWKRSYASIQLFVMLPV